MLRIDHQASCKCYLWRISHSYRSYNSILSPLSMLHMIRDTFSIYQYQLKNTHLYNSSNDYFVSQSIVRMMGRIYCFAFREECPSTRSALSLILLLCTSFNQLFCRGCKNYYQHYIINIESRNFTSIGIPKLTICAA